MLAFPLEDSAQEGSRRGPRHSGASDAAADAKGPADVLPDGASVDAGSSGGMLLDGGSGGSGGYCGNILHWNHDDDNGNSVEDRLEGPGPLQLPGGGPFNDDDLEPAIVKVDDMLASAWASSAAGGAQGLLNGMKLQISHSANLALWRTQNKERGNISWQATFLAGSDSGSEEAFY